MVTVIIGSLCGLTVLVLLARQVRLRKELQARLNGFLVHDQQTEPPSRRDGDHCAGRDDNRLLSVAEIQARIGSEAERTRPIPRPYPRARQGRPA